MAVVINGMDLTIEEAIRVARDMERSRSLMMRRNV